MTTTFRACNGAIDFPAISDFLFSLYQPDNRDGNWLQPIWEYAYTHPWFDDASVERIGLWEDGGRLAGVCHFELRLGEAFFNVAPAYAHLKPTMLDHAERALAAVDEHGARTLRAYVHESDTALAAEVARRGYTRDEPGDRPMAQIAIPHPFPPIRVAEGYRLLSLADDNDLAKVDRVLWRGFDHPGEPPPDGVEDRRRMQSGPHFRRDLTIVAQAPNGDFAAFSGLWFDAVNAIAYVEPVATDPSYRRLGLGTAALREGLRRCGALGARVGYVGSDQLFYLAMGFRRLHALRCWRTELPGL